MHEFETNPSRNTLRIAVDISGGNVVKIDPSLQTNADSYNILTNLVVRRPIAWVTSLSSIGFVNLAPFSFFNAVGSDPLYVVISIGCRDDGSLKDTARNIQANSELVVNLVTKDLLAAMNVSAVEFPPEESELTAANLHIIRSIRVKAPRLAESQASLECELLQSHSLGANTLI